MLLEIPCSHSVNGDSNCGKVGTTPEEETSQMTRSSGAHGFVKCGGRFLIAARAIGLYIQCWSTYFPSRPTNTSNTTAAGRRMSFAPSNVGSEDDWDDMDCCAKCLNYFCVGPRADRERFRPWKKKLRAVLEGEKQAKEEKQRAKAEKRRAEQRRRRNQ
ncbi:hypothetical protein PAXRUDRAFT_771505, partial [Paxillus rubicundulus Ve08.2h10]